MAHDLVDRFLLKRVAVLASMGGYLATAKLPTSAASGRLTHGLRGRFPARGVHRRRSGVPRRKPALRLPSTSPVQDTLATQIKNGAPADVFASANIIQMKIVHDANLLDGAPRFFAKNRIVLITPKTNPGNVSGLADLSKPGVKVVLAEQSEPIGIYAREAFKKMAGHGFPADYAEAVERNVVSNEMNEKAVAAKITLGEGRRGCSVFDRRHPGERLPTDRLFVSCGSLRPDISYQIAALKDSQNTAGACAFVAFAVGDGQAFMRDRGFLAP